MIKKWARRDFHQPKICEANHFSFRRKLFLVKLLACKKVVLNPDILSETSFPGLRDFLRVRLGFCEPPHVPDYATPA